MNIKHSILIITYNQENIVSNAIESAINQTELPYEIIISDDCSTDNTYKILQKYSKKYPDLIKINQNKKNLGIHGNIEKILSLCNGDVISFCGGDDYLSLNSVEIVNNLILENNINLKVDRFVLISNSKMYKSNGDIENRLNAKTKFDFFRAMLRKNYSFIKVGVSKNIFENINYPYELGLWADWGWDVNIASKVNKVIFTNYFFYNYNVRVGITSNTKQQDLVKSYIKVSNYLLYKYKNKLNSWDTLFLKLEKASCYFQLNKSLFNYLNFLFLFLININNIGTKAGIKSYLAKLISNVVLKIFKKNI